MKKTSRLFILILLAVTLSLTVLAVQSLANTSLVVDGQICTQEAKLCPDGSYVSRTGPNCEFAACPNANGAVCTQDAKQCPDGSYVSRTGPNCEFAACPNVIGGERDKHGCLVAAGYSWCAVKNKCLRTWEEKCEKAADASAACSKNAISKRDNAIIAARDAYAGKTKKAIELRRDALMAAYDKIGKDRTAATKKAWSDYGFRVSQARKELNKTVNQAWQNFHKDMKACNKNYKIDATGTATDNVL
jgi:hypothetical protein